MYRKTVQNRILMCEPVIEQHKPQPQWYWWQTTVDLVAQPGTIVDFGGLRQACSGTSTFAQSYSGIQMALRAHEAEKDGYDAFIIGCASDMGLRECRALVNIPVVAPTESASVLACALGNKFSIINLQPSADPGIELAVRNAGVIGKLASIRCPPGLTVPKAFSLSLGNKSEQKRLIEMLTNEMVRAVIEDKAEALFISCTHTSAFLSSQGIREVEDVPVLDIFAASLKMAETYLALKRGYETKVCRKSVYMAPSADWETQISQPSLSLP